MLLFLRKLNVNKLFNKTKYFFIFGILLWLCFSCNTTKFVPEGEYLLSKVSIKSSPKIMENDELKEYLKQRPNFKVFDIWNMRLGIYSLAGHDTTKWINRFFKNVGSAPVIYDESLAEKSADEIKRVFFNKGYMEANIKYDTRFDKKKAFVTYSIAPNEPYKIIALAYNIEDYDIEKIVFSDTINSIVQMGMIFDGDKLNQERIRIVNILRQKGYYTFTKENIHYFADSLHLSKEVKLTMNIRNIPFGLQVTDSIKSLNIRQHVYNVNNVHFIIDNANNPERRNRWVDTSIPVDTIGYDGYYIIQRGEQFKPSFLVQNCFIQPFSRYNENDIKATYNALSSLQALEHANIHFEEIDSANINCNIYLTSTKSQSISTSLEGTNSAGDLGVAGNINYQHRNIFKGSEVFNIKLRGAYEALSGNLSDLWKDNYMEIGAEASILFPKFQFPFFSRELKKQLRASTEYGLAFGRQERPEYERVVLSGSWKFNWSIGDGRYRHSVNPVFFDYIHIPRMSDDFKEDLTEYPALLHSFEDHVIAGSSYSYHTTNQGSRSSKKSVYSIRAAIETSGNLVYALSHLFGREKNDKGQYSLFNVPISQYVKADFDFARTHVIDDDNSFAYHIGLGFAYPYKNASIMPFEKRYYAGGANSVRGWSVRTLGPGRYVNTGERIDFANQVGDIRLDMNIEWRTHIFWLFQLAGYVDAGNIWTIDDYESQPGGEFKLKEFYKQIAVSYGLGLRLDFKYFLIRLDSGMKAYDPSRSDDPWVFVKPKFSRDFALHFAIGYPF